MPCASEILRGSSSTGSRDYRSGPPRSLCLRFNLASRSAWLSPAGSISVCAGGARGRDDHGHASAEGESRRLYAMSWARHLNRAGAVRAGHVQDPSTHNRAGCEVAGGQCDHRTVSLRRAPPAQTDIDPAGDSHAERDDGCASQAQHCGLEITPFWIKMRSSGAPAPLLNLRVPVLEAVL
jgi:hypothetical protein